MTFAELRHLLAPLDPAGTVTVGWLLAQLDADTADHIREHTVAADLPRPDLTVAELAERVGRHPSTVRGWLERKMIAGAYLDHAGRHRIPVPALLEWERAEREPKPKAAAPTKQGKCAGLSAWQDVA